MRINTELGTYCPVDHVKLYHTGSLYKKDESVGIQLQIEIPNDS